MNVPRTDIGVNIRNFRLRCISHTRAAGGNFHHRSLDATLHFRNTGLELAHHKIYGGARFDRFRNIPLAVMGTNAHPHGPVHHGIGGNVFESYRDGSAGAIEGDDIGCSCHIGVTRLFRGGLLMQGHGGDLTPIEK